MASVRAGVGDDECGEDVVGSINTYGSWQAGMAPAARPNLQQARLRCEKNDISEKTMYTTPCNMQCDVLS